MVDGNPGKRRINDAEPVAPPLGAAPSSWTPEQKILWYEIVNSAPDLVLTNADRLLVELAARLLAQVRAEPVVSPPLATQMRQCLAELGMTPSARARLVVAAPKSANPFGALD